MQILFRLPVATSRRPTRGLCVSAAYAAHADDPFGFDDNDPAFSAKPLVSARLPVPTGAGGPAESDALVPAPYTDLASISDPSKMVPSGRLYDPSTGLQRQDDEGEDEDEGEETAEEAYRRRQWIIYYVSIGGYTEAEDIGWDGRSPPDAS